MLTQRGVLKREGDDVLDTLERHAHRVTRKTLADHDLDATKVVGRAPIALLKELLTERWKLESLKFAILGKFYDKSTL